MEWDINKKPSASICPKAFCFLWSEEGRGCDEAFGECRRATAKHADADYYEPCEPELEKHGLPWFYFIAGANELTGERRGEYLRETEKLWGISNKPHHTFREVPL
ncbi:MAG: hypothetical protein LBI44_03480 [Oscillospiraceae bacterium]|jgi:hypothetical protein|nr:hypothetical protein [Oscillospiraceae bacterium]